MLCELAHEVHLRVMATIRNFALCLSIGSAFLRLHVVEGLRQSSWQLHELASFATETTKCTGGNGGRITVGFSFLRNETINIKLNEAMSTYNVPKNMRSMVGWAARSQFAKTAGLPMAHKDIRDGVVKSIVENVEGGAFNSSCIQLYVIKTVSKHDAMTNSNIVAVEFEICGTCNPTLFFDCKVVPQIPMMVGVARSLYNFFQWCCPETYRKTMANEIKKGYLTRKAAGQHMMAFREKGLGVLNVCIQDGWVGDEFINYINDEKACPQVIAVVADSPCIPEEA